MFVCLYVCPSVCASHFSGRYLIDFSVKFHAVTLQKETRFFVVGHTGQISALWWPKLIAVDLWWLKGDTAISSFDLLVIFLHFCQKIVNDTQKTESCHDANFIITVEAGSGHYDSHTATGASDDKVSIMMTYFSVYLACTRYQPYRYRCWDRIATIL